MKNKFSILVLFLVCYYSINAQTTTPREKAEVYHKANQLKYKYTNTWYWLFGTEDDSYKTNRNNTVAWELEDGGWYTGIGKNDTYTGYGVQYKLKSNSYIFSNWKDTKPNGLTLFQDPGYSFIGTYKDDAKNGFGITKWSNYKSFSNENYKDVIKYVGEYKDGIWSGYGVIYFIDGTYKSGIFVDSILTKELPKIVVLEALGF